MMFDGLGAAAEVLPEGERVTNDTRGTVDTCLASLLHDTWSEQQALEALHIAGATGIVDLVSVTTRVARALGERWIADLCSFSDVTFGLHRLTLLLFAIEELPDVARESQHGGRVLLSPMPGDQHSFGLATVALALRRAGWDVTLELPNTAEALIATARRGFDCIGLSVGHDRAIPLVAGLIRELRGSTARSAPRIAVGGPMLVRDPTLASTVGADIATGDGFELAEWLRPLRQSRAA